MKKIKLREGEVESVLDLGDFVLEFADDGALISLCFDEELYT